MKKDSIKFTKMPQVASVYEYVLPHTSVPLLVLHSWASLPILPGWGHALQGVVVLTPDDIRHGVDAFALTYVHMHARSSLQFWNDVFAELVYQPTQVINHMELLLRSTLIDLREMIVLWRSCSPAFAHQILLCLDRILCGRWYVQTMAIEPLELLALTDLIDGKYDMKIKDLITLLHTQVTKRELPIIYENLLALVHKIDTLTQ